MINASSQHTRSEGWYLCKTEMDLQLLHNNTLQSGEIVVYYDFMFEYYCCMFIVYSNQQKVTDSVRNLIMGHVWIFQPDNNPKTNLKNNTKMGHWAQNQASAMANPVFWPEPCRKWVRWTEEKKHRHGAVNLKDLERFWMKEWSLISCQVFSNIIRHYRKKLLYYFGKWRFQKLLNTRVPLIMSNVY